MLTGKDVNQIEEHDSGRPKTDMIWTIVGQYHDDFGRQIRKEHGRRSPDDQLGTVRFIGKATVMVQNGQHQMPIPVEFEIPAETPREAFEAFDALVEEAARKEYGRRMAAVHARRSPIIRPGG